MTLSISVSGCTVSGRYRSEKYTSTWMLDVPGGTLFGDSR